MPIELKINRMLFVTQSHTILGNLVSSRQPGPALSFEDFVASVLAAVELSDPASSDGSLKFIPLSLMETQVPSLLLFTIRSSCSGFAASRSSLFTNLRASRWSS